MELRHLRYFVAVAGRLHFGRAAVELGIAQPSLSHQIRQLEAELRTTLLQRTKRRVQLTEPGRLFLEQAREILARADHAAVTARRASLGEVGRLRIGFAYWMDLTSIVAMVGGLHQRQPAASVDLRAMSVPSQIAALRDERLEVGLVRPPIAEPWLQTKLVAVEPLVVALPEGHRLASNRRIPVSALSREPHVLVPRDVVPVFYDLTLELCREAGFVPHVQDEVDHPETVLGLVAAGLGVSLVPAWACKLVRPGVVFRPLRPSPPIIQTMVAWRRDATSPLVAELLRVVRDIAASARQAGRAEGTREAAEIHRKKEKPRNRS